MMAYLVILPETLLSKELHSVQLRFPSCLQGLSAWTFLIFFLILREFHT